MYPEEAYIAISALQHWIYCPRQCGLIHLEQVWNESSLTAAGRQMHTRAHCEETRMEHGILVARSLRLASSALGLTGLADVVEFHPDPEGISLSGRDGLYQPFPVEFKKGKKKTHDADEVQLCAQAISLEEMLGVSISSGALFYGQTHRRKPVAFTSGLRDKVAQTARAIHAMFDEGQLPPAIFSEKCKRCSLLDLCQPKATSHAESYLESHLMSTVYKEFVS